MLDDLRGKRCERLAGRCKQSVAESSEKQDSDAYYVREPFGYLRIVPIEYIARGRVVIAEKQVQIAFLNA